jgi:hypothetical protein
VTAISADLHARPPQCTASRTPIAGRHGQAGTKRYGPSNVLCMCTVSYGDADPSNSSFPIHPPNCVVYRTRVMFEYRSQPCHSSATARGMLGTGGMGVGSSWWKRQPAEHAGRAGHESEHAENRAGEWPAHLDHGARAAAHSVVVVDHEVLERLHEAALDVAGVCRLHGGINETLATTHRVEEEFWASGPSVEIVPKPLLGHSVISQPQRDQVYSECHYSPRVLHVKFP